jgi:hypothetical protein
LHADAYLYPNGNKRVLALSMSRLNGSKYYTVHFGETYGYESPNFKRQVDVMPPDSEDSQILCFDAVYLS